LKSVGETVHLLTPLLARMDCTGGCPDRLQRRPCHRRHPGISRPRGVRSRRPRGYRIWRYHWAEGVCPKVQPGRPGIVRHQPCLPGKTKENHDL